MSIWSDSLQTSLASVTIPVEPNVPPALEKLGVNPQVNLVAAHFDAVPFLMLPTETYPWTVGKKLRCSKIAFGGKFKV